MANKIYLHSYIPAMGESGAQLLQSEIVGNYTAVTANTTLVINTNSPANSHWLVEVTANSPTLTLPTAVGIQGAELVVKNTGAGTVTLASNGGTIDGASTQSLTQYQSLTVVSNGTNWILI